MTKNMNRFFFGLGVAAALATAHACGGSSNPSDITVAPGSPDGGTPDGGTVPDCFSGTPVTNDQFLNACTPSTTAKVLKVSSIPRGKATLPPLP